MPVKYKPDPTPGSYHWTTITKDVVLHVIKHTQSNRQAAIYLGVCKQTWKKYASMYFDEYNNNLYSYHNNKYRYGCRKDLYSESDEARLLSDIITGKLSPTERAPKQLKEEIIKEGYMEEKCHNCGFKDQRVSDLRTPILLVFKDGDNKNWELNNLSFYCYNCYFLYIGEIYTKKQIDYIEGFTRKLNKRAMAELDDVHTKALEEILSDKQQKDPGREEILPDDLIDTY